MGSVTHFVTGPKILAVHSVKLASSACDCRMGHVSEHHVVVFFAVHSWPLMKKKKKAAPGLHGTTDESYHVAALFTIPRWPLMKKKVLPLMKKRKIEPGLHGTTG